MCVSAADQACAAAVSPESENTMLSNTILLKSSNNITYSTITQRRSCLDEDNRSNHEGSVRVTTPDRAFRSFAIFSLSISENHSHRSTVILASLMIHNVTREPVLQQNPDRFQTVGP